MRSKHFASRMRSRFLIKVLLPELAGFAYSTAAWAGAVSDCLAPPGATLSPLPEACGVAPVFAPAEPTLAVSVRPVLAALN